MADNKVVPLDDDEFILAPEGKEAEKAPAEPADEPISLVEGTATGATAVRALGAAATVQREGRFKRPVNLTGAGAVRCRVFYSKIAVASLTHMEDSINEWLDSAKVEVKHVGHVIGTMEGKRPEPNLIVMVWY